VRREKDGENEFTINLNTGRNQIKMIYNKQSVSSSVIVKSIKIVGTAVSNGMGLDCVLCKDVRLNHHSFIIRDSLLTNMILVSHVKLDIVLMLNTLLVKSVQMVIIHQFKGQFVRNVHQTQSHQIN
jgi:hypothetical protein